MGRTVLPIFGSRPLNVAGGRLFFAKPIAHNAALAYPRETLKDHPRGSHALSHCLSATGLRIAHGSGNSPLPRCFDHASKSRTKRDHKGAQPLWAAGTTTPNATNGKARGQGYKGEISMGSDPPTPAFSGL